MREWCAAAAGRKRRVTGLGHGTAKLDSEMARLPLLGLLVWESVSSRDTDTNESHGWLGHRPHMFPPRHMCCAGVPASTPRESRIGSGGSLFLSHTPGRRETSPVARLFWSASLDFARPSCLHESKHQLSRNRKTCFVFKTTRAINSQFLDDGFL